MKNLIYNIFAVAGLVIIMTSNSATAQTVKADSVSMGPGYANEVYYSLASGAVATVPRNQWDIAFRTSILSSSIITNDGAGVILYTYPKADSSGWATVDTAGLSSWPQMFNDPDEWENGAFSRNATGHPDYGWGIYNQQTHNLAGDSIFIIQLRDGSFRKIWIRAKKSSLDVYEFRYANLDGSNEQNVSLNLIGHLDKDFYGYDLQNNQEVDFQPAKDQWDLLFTRYKDINTGQPYTVIGVLSNNYLNVKRFSGVPQTYEEWWVSDWDSTRSSIGYDWKVFTGTGYEMDDSLVYFIKDNQGDIYKLYFTKFEGSSTGNIGFNVGKISSIGVREKNDPSLAVSISPNPAKEIINVRYSKYTPGDVITIISMAGQTMMKQNASAEATTLDISGLSQGVYFVKITSGENKTSTKKFIISR